MATLKSNVQDEVKGDAVVFLAYLTPNFLLPFYYNNIVILIQID